jgi:[ribosomal protein S18]-alanine N-acetyltransferase
MDRLKAIQLNPQDLSAVILIANELNRAAFDWGPIELEESFKYNEVWGLINENDIVGFAIIADRSVAWELLSICVSRPHHGKKWGEYFLRQLITAKQQKPEWWLEVHEKNEIAQKLYLSCGFKPQGRRLRYYKDGAAAIIMTKTS